MHTLWLSVSLLAPVLAAVDKTLYSPDLREALIVADLPLLAPIKKPTELKVVDTVLRLSKRQGDSPSSAYVNAIRDAAMQKRGLTKRVVTGVVPLNGISGSIYTAPIAIGPSTYQLVVDTGSSDPWIAVDNFRCIDPSTHAALPQSACDFGPLYKPSASNTWRAISGQNFNVSYADGENLNGDMSLETFTLGGITVTNQEFGAVTKAAWYGDGVSSGLVGFAYSSLTSAYAGNDPSTDVRSQHLIYNTLFTNMYQRQLTSPVFSMRLTRDGDATGSTLVLGGLPDSYSSSPSTPLPYFATVPIQPVGINATSQQLVYQFYSIAIDGWAISASRNAQFDTAGTGNKRKTALIGNGTQVIIDSGTSLIYAPNDVAASVAAAFNPPATLDAALGAYTVDCSAKAPFFGITIAKKVFQVNPVDLFLPTGSAGLCYMGVQPDQGGLTIVGDVFLKNVLAVFDIGAQQMRFAARSF